MQQQPATDPSEPPAPGAPPVELELADGSKLVLEEAAGSPIVCRIDGSAGGRITLEDVRNGSGEPFAGYRRLR